MISPQMAIYLFSRHRQMRNSIHTKNVLYRSIQANELAKRMGLQSTVATAIKGVTLLIIFLCFIFSANAQLSGYSFRKKLTIDYTKISGSSDLSDFPLLISVTDTDLMTILNGGDVTSDNGYDVAFTAVDGTTQLDHDLQSFNAATGAYQAFVRIPTFSASVNTEIYMYYGNADVTSDPSSTGTWDSNYVGVWHMEENGSGTSDEYADMSGNNNHGQGGAGTAARVPTQTTGQIGNAQSFDGSDDLINCGSGASLDNNNTFTFSAWVNIPDILVTGRLFEKRATSAEAKNFYIQNNEQLRFVHNSDAGQLAERSSAVTIGGWQHVTMTWSGTMLRTSVDIYINGVLSNVNGVDGSGTPLDDSGGDFWIGNRHDAGRPFLGLVDEVHFSDVVRSQDWIITEYDNQNDPGSFLVSSGSEEPTSFPGNVSAGLMIWLRANSGVLNAPDVTAWADQTGVSNAVAVAAGDPQLVEDAINFNPAMDLNGTTDYFETITNSIIGGSNPYTKFAVAVSDNTSANSQLISSDGAGDLEMRHDASGNLLATHAATDLFSGGGSFTQGTPSIAVIRYGSGGLDNIGRLDGVSLVDNTTAAFSDAGAFQIGAFNGSGFWNGRIAEAILVDSELSDADITKIESYLAVKYGITLASSAGNYIASDGSTIIWNPTTYSAHHYDVAGIGRDDASLLDQQKSMSSNADAMVIMDKGGSFTTDLDFLLWGNDDQPLALTTTDKHPSYDRRLEREWRVAINGSPGTVDVRIVYPGVADAVSGYALHVDADGTFASGTTDYTPTSISGDTLTFENVTFANGNYFTLSINHKAPGDIKENLALWLKVDVGTSGSPVTDWQDQSGNGNDGTGVGTPVLTANSLNYNPGIDFVEGDVDHFTLSSPAILPTGSEARSYFVVSKAGASGTTQPTLSHGTNAVFRRVELSHSTTEIAVRFNNANDIIASTITTQIAMHTYGSGENIDPGFDTHQNGLALSHGYGGTPLNPLNTGDNLAYIGRNVAGAQSLTGTILEVIAYDRDLTETANHAERVQSYLALKYGITLDNSHGDYLASDGTQLWDATGYATHHNGIAGIGRDDASTLDQQKSMSTNADAMVIMDKGGAFSSDLDFIVWGNNNSAIALTTTDKHPSYDRRLERVWRVAVNGTPGTVDLRMVFTGVSNAVSDYVLHVDGDGTFASGSTDYASPAISGDTLTFTNVSFSDGDYFTLSVNHKAPGNLKSNLVLWLKGDVGTSTTTDNTSLSDWQDQSGNGNDVSQGTGASQPTFKNNATNNINYNPVVDFDGTDDFISTTSTDLLLNPDGHYTKFGVVVTQTLGASDQTIIAGSDALAHIFRINTVAKLAIMHNNSQVRVNNTIIEADTPILAVGRYSPTGTHAVRLSGNGAEGGTDNTLNDGALDIGGFRNGNATAEQFLDGYIAEVITYNTPLTTAEIRRVESYLGIKYGITLDNSAGGANGDYLASDASTIWDADVNSAFHNDVILIGRDDNSDLLQKQSQSKDDSLTVYIDALAADNASNTGTITNNESFLVIGHNGERLMAHAPQESPSGIISRFNREWKITNTNFTDTYSLVMEWEEEGAFDINDIRLLVDDDGNFSDATTLKHGDLGLSITEGSIIIGGISTSVIPANSTRYITIGSTTFSTSLPMELIGFEAIPNDEQHNVTLNWSTASEKNNDFFTVEKSANVDDWEAVSQISGAGNSEERLDYEVIDSRPYPGLSYYRLKQTDFDGQFSYSPIKPVTLGNGPSKKLSLYPNPAQDQIVIVGSHLDVSPMHVYNVQGQDVSNLTRWQEGPAPQTILLDISRLDHGIYTISGTDTSLKFVKEK